jgi:DHA2 family multidrug resistance protein-like MFS transporter
MPRTPKRTMERLTLMATMTTNKKLDAAALCRELIIAGNVVFSIGMAPCTTIIADLIVSAAPQEQSGAASALSEMASELGGALGIALLGSLVTLIYRRALSARVPPMVHGEALERALRGIGSAVSSAQDDGGSALVSAAQGAYSDAVQAAFWASACIVLVAAVGALAMFGTFKPRG